MFEPASEQDTAGEIRAGLIAIALLFVFGLVFLVAFREDWTQYLLLAGVCAFMVAFHLSIYRWGIPWARRLNSRLGGLEDPLPPVKQSDDESRPSGGSPDGESRTTAMSRMGWYRRVRFQIALGLIEPIVVVAIAALFVGEPILLLGLGLLMGFLGVCQSLVWFVRWNSRRDELEERGFVW